MFFATKYFCFVLLVYTIARPTSQEKVLIIKILISFLSAYFSTGGFVEKIALILFSPLICTAVDRDADQHIFCLHKGSGQRSGRGYHTFYNLLETSGALLRTSQSDALRRVPASKNSSLSYKLISLAGQHNSGGASSEN